MWLKIAIAVCAVLLLLLMRAVEQVTAAISESNEILASIRDSYDQVHGVEDRNYEEMD